MSDEKDRPPDSGGGKAPKGEPRTDYWVLRDGRMQPADLMTWAAWLESPERVVEKTVVSDDVSVSTMFIGLDYNVTGIASGRRHLPYCWETLITGGPHNGRLWRYATQGDAKRGHWQVVEALSAGEEPNPARAMRNPLEQLIDLAEGRFDPAELERELEEGTLDDPPE